MGLIARQLEESGLPTVVMTSARDITEAVNPPRAVFLDFPLGHTSGRPNQPALGREIVATALEAFTAADYPGWIGEQSLHWDETDDWKVTIRPPMVGDQAGGGSADDDRAARVDTPQYQSVDDALAAEMTHDGERRAVVKGVDY